jgi:SAM-dependent methyltransferase
MSGEPLFDAHAEDFDETLAHALEATGEDKNYFARGRVQWLRRCLDELGVQPRDVLDFGCGTGSATPFLLDVLGAATVSGVDVSIQSIKIAASRWDSPRATFSTVEDGRGLRADLVFCNGVFHHIPIDQRAAAVSFVHDALGPDDYFALWENNPWNPGTRFVMGRCAFDQDAIMLSPAAARRMLVAGGFEIVRTDFQFIFPHALRALRALEQALARLPLGGQYQILCRKCPSPRTT